MVELAQALLQEGPWSWGEMRGRWACSTVWLSMDNRRPGTSPLLKTATSEPTPSTGPEFPRKLLLCSPTQSHAFRTLLPGAQGPNGHPGV